MTINNSLATPARKSGATSRRDGHPNNKEVKRMNEQQTQLLLIGMINLMRKMAAGLANHETRMNALEDDETQENLAAFMELMPLVDALSAQVSTPPEPMI